MHEKWTDDDIAKGLRRARRRLASVRAHALNEVPIDVLGIVERDLPFLLELVDRLRAKQEGAGE